MYTKDQSKAFFDQLAEFSRRYIQAELKLQSISPWGTNQFNLKGAILHFTADPDFHKVARWFLKDKYAARVSSHAIVADRPLASAAEFYADLPLVAALPVTVVQVREPWTQAYHATWTNPFCYGIENICAGELRKSEDGFVCGLRKDANSQEWTMPWNSPYKEPVELYGRWWDPYPKEQVQTNIEILRYLQGLYGTLEKPWVLGHENVQSVNTRKSNGTRMGTDKRDPCPAFPTEEIREAVFSDTPVDEADWFHHFSGDHRYGESVRDGWVIDFFRETTGKALSAKKAWKAFGSEMEKLPTAEQFGALGKTALRILGYHVTNPFQDELDDAERQSVWIFQRMSGISTDFDPGRGTREALVKRLQDRGYLA